MGKLAPTPCESCDFVRRHRELGIDIALQFWMRAVKSTMPITLGVVSPGTQSLEVPAPTGKALSTPSKPAAPASLRTVPYNPDQQQRQRQQQERPRDQKQKLTP